jgi:hypothetical protein
MSLYVKKKKATVEVGVWCRTEAAARLAPGL